MSEQPLTLDDDEEEMTADELAIVLRDVDSARRGAEFREQREIDRHKVTRAALATAQQQVRDLRAALEGVLELTKGLKDRSDNYEYVAEMVAKAALAATAEPEAGR